MGYVPVFLSGLPAAIFHQKIRQLASCSSARVRSETLACDLVYTALARASRAATMLMPIAMPSGVHSLMQSTVPALAEAG